MISSKEEWIRKEVSKVPKLKDDQYCEVGYTLRCGYEKCIKTAYALSKHMKGKEGYCAARDDTRVVHGDNESLLVVQYNSFNDAVSLDSEVRVFLKGYQYD